MQTAIDFIKAGEGKELKDILIAFAKMHVSLALVNAAETISDQQIKDKIMDSYSPNSIV